MDILSGSCRVIQELKSFRVWVVWRFCGLRARGRALKF